MMPFCRRSNIPRKKAVGELNDGLVVQSKHLELPKNRETAEFSAETKAGIVDEQVDRDIAARELFRQNLACPRGG